MNRHQVLWALAKAIGIWLLIGGVLGLIDFAMILVTGDTRVSSGWFLEHPGLGSMLMNGSLRTSIGAYLLYDGSWLIRVTQRSSMAEAPEMPMDSHGLLWALIKVIGIWLLILGILGHADRRGRADVDDRVCRTVDGGTFTSTMLPVNLTVAMGNTYATEVIRVGRGASGVTAGAVSLSAGARRAPRGPDPEG